MDTQSLQTFISVARLGSISLAAEQLHLTQPAVTRRIQLLEEQLDVSLFDRINRKIKLTKAGELLLDEGQDILLKINNLSESLKSRPDIVNGRLSLAVSHHVGLHRLPSYLKAFTVKYPEVELDLRFTDSELGCQSVENGDIELAVVTLPAEQPAKLITETLWDDPLSFVCSAELQGKQKFDLAALASMPAILPTENTYTGRLILAEFAKRKLKPQIAMATNYLETIKMMVSIGLAWSILPSSMLDKQLHEIKTGIRISRKLGLVQHHQRTQSHAARAFIEVLKSAS